LRKFIAQKVEWRDQNDIDNGVTRIMYLCDKDNDGSISFNEFWIAMKRTPGNTVEEKLAELLKDVPCNGKYNLKEQKEPVQKRPTLSRATESISHLTLDTIMQNLLESVLRLSATEEPERTHVDKSTDSVPSEGSDIKYEDGTLIKSDGSVVEGGSGEEAMTEEVITEPSEETLEESDPSSGEDFSGSLQDSAESQESTSSNNGLETAKSDKQKGSSLGTKLKGLLSKSQKSQKPQKTEKQRKNSLTSSHKLILPLLNSELIPQPKQLDNYLHKSQYTTDR